MEEGRVRGIVGLNVYDLEGVEVCDVVCRRLERVEWRSGGKSKFLNGMYDFFRDELFL